MLVEITCLVGGVPLGYALRASQRAIRATEHILLWSVRILLFLLGLALGSDDALMARLGSIGVRGAFISICCLAGTLVGVRLIDPFVWAASSGRNGTHLLKDAEEGPGKKIPSKDRLENRP